MASNLVDLHTPQGRETLEQYLDEVRITCPEDIHDAAVNLARIARERGMQIAVCDDISSKEPMVDADGTIRNADIFRWLEEGTRWWEDLSREFAEFGTPFAMVTRHDPLSYPTRGREARQLQPRADDLQGGTVGVFLSHPLRVTPRRLRSLAMTMK